MYRFKKGVKVKGVQLEMVAIWPAVAAAYASFDRECIITSVMDGEHKEIVHYLGFATDFRTRNVPQGWWDKLVDRIRENLTDEYDVVLEKDHIHVEFDPREV